MKKNGIDWLLFFTTLDKNSGFTRPSFVVLLNNALEKISQFVTTPREFTYWVGTLSELKGEVLEAFCRDIDSVFAYARQKGKSVNFNQLPSILNQLYRSNHQTVILTPELLDIITDVTFGDAQRAEKLARHIVAQKIVKLGGSQNLIGVIDPVSIDELIYTVAREDTKEEKDIDLKRGENVIQNFISNHEPIKIAMKKMGKEGIYTYAETQKPAYYRHFLEDAKGLMPGFNQPGEKFRVTYLDKKIIWTKAEQTSNSHYK